MDAFIQEQVDKFVERQSELNATTVKLNSQFNVEPSVQQTFIEKQQESSDFLKEITIETEEEMIGDVVSIDDNGPIASRSDTENGEDRKVFSPYSMDDNRFEMGITDYNTKISYVDLRKWAKLPNFQQILQNRIVRRQALDRIMIGFNGTHRAASTDRAANPLLQDMHKGWLQKIREWKTGLQNMTSDGVTPNKVMIGATSSYKNLDALVDDMIENMLGDLHKDRTDLVVLCGRGILHQKYFPIRNQSNPPTEQVALQLLMSNKALGELPTYRAPSFPAGKLLITPLKNLGIKEQSAKRFRTIADEPNHKRIVDYQDVPEDFVIYDYTACAMAENISLEEPVEAPAGG